MEIELANWFLASIKDFGFPVVCCAVLYFDLRKEIRSLTEAVKLKI